MKNYWESLSAEELGDLLADMFAGESSSQKPQIVVIRSAR